MSLYVSNWVKYMEGADITRVPFNCLTFPSQNSILYKGKIYNRAGIENDGNESTEDDQIIGEKVWKDQVGGKVCPSRVVKGGDWQTKQLGKWISIFTDFSPGAVRVRFETWLDTTGALRKKRLYAVDGTEKLYEWNGAVGTIASTTGAVISVGGTKTLEQLGFDDASGGALTVIIVRFAAGAVVGQEEYTYNAAVSGVNLMTLNTTPSPLPNPGDLVIAKPIEHTGILNGMLKDELYTYMNHLGIGSLADGTIKFSNAETPLDWVIPLTSPTTLSPFELVMDGNFTAMISRKGVLWASTPDDWFKLTHSLTANPDGTFDSVEKFEQPERNGALPFAVTSYKEDAVYMSQSKRLQQITTLELTGKDALLLLSDDVEGLLDRVDMTEIRIYYQLRYIFILLPSEGLVLMLDMVGDPDRGIGMFWQPPQTIGASSMSIIEGVFFMHSNTRNETFYLFEGGDDLGADITMLIASGYIGGEMRRRYINIQDRHQLYQHTRIGIDGRITTATKVTATQFWETDGAKNLQDTILDGSTMALVAIPTDFSWASVPWAAASWTGEAQTDSSDTGNPELNRFYAFDENLATAWWEYRVVFAMTGKNQVFQLLGWSINVMKSTRKIDPKYFIKK